MDNNDLANDWVIVEKPRRNIVEKYKEKGYKVWRYYKKIIVLYRIYRMVRVCINLYVLYHALMPTFFPPF